VGVDTPTRMKTTPTACVYAAIILIAGFFLAQGLEAAPSYIDGSISFTGNVSLNGSTTSATAITSFSNVTAVVGTNGIYVPLAGSRAAVWSPFTFSPSGAPVVPLWTCATNGVSYSFDASSMAVVFTSGNFLNIQGTGIAHVTGYADTPGIWTISVQAIGASVSFTASTMVSPTNLPTIHSSLVNGNIGMSWNALAGQPYQLQTTGNPVQPAWSNILGVITTTNPTATASYPVGAESGRWFRVVVLPQ
jgi:hypothetical protein